MKSREEHSQIILKKDLDAAGIENMSISLKCRYITCCYTVFNDNRE